MNTPPDDLMISSTGEIHGHGRDPYKWVSYLTAVERAAVRDGRLVVVHRGASTHGGYPAYRKVVYQAGRYTHRVPNAIERRAIEGVTQQPDDENDSEHDSWPPDADMVKPQEEN